MGGAGFLEWWGDGKFPLGEVGRALRDEGGQAGEWPAVTHIQNSLLF